MHLAAPSSNFAGRVVSVVPGGGGYAGNLAMPGKLMTSGTPVVPGVEIADPTTIAAGYDFGAAIAAAKELSAKVPVAGSTLWEHNPRKDGTTGNQAIGVLQAADGQLLLAPLVDPSGFPSYFRSTDVNDAFAMDFTVSLHQPKYGRGDEALLAVVGADDFIDLRDATVQPYPYQ